MELHITRRTALLLFLDIAATYAAYWLASVLTDVRGEVFFNNEIYFILGIPCVHQHRRARHKPPLQQLMGIRFG